MGRNNTGSRKIMGNLFGGGKEGEEVGNCCKRKKVLVVMPKVFGQVGGWNILPVGIMYVSSSMKKAGLSVECFNSNAVGDDYLGKLAECILNHDIDIVATGDLVVNYEGIRDILDCAKNVSKEIITIMGGGFVTHSPKEAMQLVPSADYAVIGEGEITDTELVLALESGQDVSKVDGIIYRDNGNLCVTNPRKEIKYLDALPWPDYEGFHYFDVMKQISTDGFIAAMLTTSRHCPFHCTFCSSSGGQTYRQRSLDSIFEELDYLVNHYHVKRLILNDELFAVNEERVAEFCQRIAPYGLQWVIYLRIGKHIQLPILQAMNKAGCVTIFYGLESASNEVLTSMRKGTTKEEMLRVLEMTRQAGLIAKGGFIFGDTVETIETARYTMEWAKKYCDLISDLYFHPICLYPGSALYEKAVREGKIKDTVKFIADYCPPINVSEKMDNTTYNQLIYSELPDNEAEILCQNERRHREKLQAKIAPDHAHKTYNLTFVCEKCGNFIELQVASTDLYLKNFHCSDCGLPYSFNLFALLIQQYEERITAFLSEHKCVLWGLAPRTHLLYHSNAYFRENDNIALLDRNNVYREMGFHGRAVYSPNDCKWENYDVLILGMHQVIHTDVLERVKKANSNIKIVQLQDILLEI